ncbi:MAG TPA: peptidylprolyl isomerase [Candidatus Alistipes avicola]|uniref:Peptidylprolyl isomerase n=1 Tax=Candidatus Alistipes avicola TaxID=2838432 RepID=A0A9D2ICX3_9BACT|nr:peptidylprolyl isomerase [uncultured Alistipes sp.]HJA98028.1 peptidylprolyl isomerase [Candidatus Alistipes avicola]
MIRKILLSVAFFLGAFVVSAQENQVMLDRVVAVVGNSSILRSEVDEYARELLTRRRQQGYTSDRDPQNEALELLLTQKLLFNQGLIDSVEVNISDISQRVEEHLQALIENAGGIAELETRHHMAIFNIREMLRQRYEEQAYANMMQSTVVSKVRITPGEVERFYREIDPDSLPVIAEQYVYAQITKFPFSMKEAKQRTRERLLDMRERIIKGQTSFEVMARMYSLDPGTAIRGGELEPQPLDALTRPFADALAELKPGQISEIVETEYGYHIIQLIDKRGRIYHARHIRLYPTYASEELAQPARMLDSIADLIRKDSITFEAAALEFSDDASTKMNGGIVTNHAALEMGHYFDARYTETRFRREDFGMGGSQTLDDYNALKSLKEGEVSDSFLTEDWMGNQLCKIVKLVRVIPPHQATLNEDYLQVEQMALSAKQERVFKEWIKEKIDGMYVYIIPEFRNGEFENKNWVK